MEIKKKIQAIRLLKKLEGSDAPEMAVIESLLNEIKTLELMIPDTIDISPIKRNIEDIRGQYASLSATLAAFDVEVSNIKSSIHARDEQGIAVSQETEANFKLLEEKIAELRKDLIGRLSNKGGGNANRNIQVKGVNVLSPYTDINLKAGSNVTLSVATNNTTKYTEITIAASSGGSTIETPIGTVDSVNATFTVSAQPQYIVSDGITYFNGAGYTYSPLQIILDIPPSQFIRAII